MKKIRLLLVDDHTIVRQGFASLINTVPDMTVIDQATDGAEAVNAYRLHQPDITLMD